MCLLKGNEHAVKQCQYISCFWINVLFITNNIIVYTGILMLTNKAQVYFEQKNQLCCYEFTHTYVDYFFVV